MNTPSRIKPLSPHVANQIAAGEVIERPVSIVKELAENAIDAKATRIDLHIGFGGLNEITMTDNGLGIIEDDLPLAVAPHATSKIITLADLYHLHSLGFRGEALASIASVSKLTLTSKTANQSHAMQITNVTSDWKMLPAAHALGTTIEVHDLFFNAPVRKKFLKSATIEFQYIDQLVKQMALCSSDITWVLTHDGKQVRELLAAHDELGTRKRLARIFGKTFMTSAIPVYSTHDLLTLSGFVSHPDYQRSQHDHVWIYVNGRIVRDALILHAIKQSYAPYLAPGRYPACVLYLNVPTEFVDVNVHPNKYEVRFQEPRLVHDLIRTVLTASLQPCQVFQTLPQTDIHLTKTPLKAAMTSSGSFEIMPLNSRFSLLKEGKQTSLIAIKRLIEDWLLETLQKTPKPFKKRSLGVPVLITQMPLHRIDIDLLKQVGIDVSFVDKTTLKIDTLPLGPLHLNIQHFFHALIDNCDAPLTPVFQKTFQNVSHEDDLFKLLVAHHIIDVQTLTEGFWQELKAWIATSKKPAGAYVIPLSPETCDSLFLCQTTSFI